jgi:hypothetical protein
MLEMRLGFVKLAGVSEAFGEQAVQARKTAAMTQVLGVIGDLLLVNSQRLSANLFGFLRPTRAK